MTNTVEVAPVDTTKLHLRLSPDIRQTLEKLSDNFQVPQTCVLVYALTVFNQICNDEKTRDSIKLEIQKRDREARIKAIADRKKRNQVKIEQGAKFGRAATKAKNESKSKSKVLPKSTKTRKTQKK